MAGAQETAQMAPLDREHTPAAGGGQPAAGHEPSEDGSVFGNRDFRSMFIAAAASRFGTQISYLAVPLLAIQALHAGAGAVGLLTTLATLPYLLIGLPAGAWVDRMRRRPVQITADLLRMALFGTLPLAAALHVLTLWQLYTVVLFSGCATVFFEVASQSYLPFVVGRPGLVAANARLASLTAVSQVAGRGVGGFLIQAITAPFAIAIYAGCYLWSALWLLRIRSAEPQSGPRREARLWREIGEGLRFVLGHPLLRPIALSATLTNLSVQISVVMLPVVFVRQLGLSDGVLGLYLTSGGAGVFLGTSCARAIGRRLGNGRAMWIIGVASTPLVFALPFIGRGALLWLAALAWLATTFQVGVNNVLQVSFRQRATPDELLGRMNATMRFLLTGALAVGSGIAGLIAQYLGLRTVLWVGAVGLALAWVPCFLSPLRGMRDLP
ncbi:MFS transporter [Actinocrinis puniceicyclus]|uniref:MFS transporter n=1 Tax=Actinocrinis puniceicyclus TaxID=977794 RepID=A0A8J7WP19_9ACTN|nr:MFS transporter [Actinocrinis puniceicyclus]MBS2962955.1 MFS transporter [Actinocrinis puniceicyclus]